MFRLRSWASSIIRTSYAFRSRSEWASIKRMPSVMSLMTVRGLD